MKTFFKYFIAVCLLLTVMVPCVFAQSNDVKVAFLRVDNINRDPRYDYLSGMISGILLYDLSSTDGLIVIDRRALEDVLKEQELSLGDLSTKDQIRVGQLLGAKQLLTAGFVFLGDEVMVNLTLVNVETSKSIVLSRRGRTENTIHLVMRRASRSQDQLTSKKRSFGAPQTGHLSGASLLTVLPQMPQTNMLPAGRSEPDLTASSASLYKPW